MLKEKSPEEIIKEIEKIFSRPYSYPFYEKKKSNICFIAGSVLAVLILLSVLFFVFSPSFRIETENLGTTEKTIKTEEKKGCFLSVSYDNEVVNLILDFGVKDMRIVSAKKLKRNNIKFFVGDFRTFNDSVIVSSRLNDKSIPNKIEKVNEDFWRVYINLEVPELQVYYNKPNISQSDVSDMEKLISGKVGEVVRVEVFPYEVPVADVIVELEKREQCESLVNFLKSKGKKVVTGLFLRI